MKVAFCHFIAVMPNPAVERISRTEPHEGAYHERYAERGDQIVSQTS
jgi:hypothetical protein